uniref:Reverse transcriptase domain-containing protein n=1 Tax=Scylla olivacea TaxID=85551 RepID=A0A0P4WE59_SCYOL
MGIQGPTLTWLHDFLMGHSFQVAIGASISTPHHILRGVPQGSILLFNVLLSDLSLPTNSHHLIYADETLPSSAGHQHWQRHRCSSKKQRQSWVTGCPPGDL